MTTAPPRSITPLPMSTEELQCRIAWLNAAWAHLGKPKGELQALADGYGMAPRMFHEEPVEGTVRG